jgi:mono/diheme cytochrome c family protein
LKITQFSFGRLLMLAAVALIILCGCSKPGATTTTMQTTSTLSPGAQFYAANCSVCHGSDRQGTNLGIALPTTEKTIANDTDAQLAAFIVTHRISINFTQDQLTAIVSFLKTGS